MKLGILLVGSLALIILVEHYLDNQAFDANIEAGFAFQKSTDSLILRKLLRLTSATTKNYETGQINNVKGCCGRLIGFVFEFSGFVMTPLQLITAVIQLYLLIGTSFLFGVSLLGICFYVDRKVREAQYELDFERGKTGEKKSKSYFRIF
jgi:hypothetical protein